MKVLVDRLEAANPGWDEWTELIDLVKSFEFELIKNEYMGNFYISGTRLTFAELRSDFTWPDWLPAYVPALYGMKADEWEMAGGYADSFYDETAEKGSVFSPAGNDEDLGFPLIEVPADLYSFQSNAHGATFFINKSLEICYPNSDDEQFETMDSLEEFTRKNIQQALDGDRWFSAYSDLKGTLLD